MPVDLPAALDAGAQPGSESRCESVGRGAPLGPGADLNSLRLPFGAMADPRSAQRVCDLVQDRVPHLVGRIKLEVKSRKPDRLGGQVAGAQQALRVPEFEVPPVKPVLPHQGQGFGAYPVHRGGGWTFVGPRWDGWDRWDPGASLAPGFAGVRLRPLAPPRRIWLSESTLEEMDASRFLVANSDRSTG